MIDREIPYRVNGEITDQGSEVVYLSGNYLLQDGRLVAKLHPVETGAVISAPIVTVSASTWALPQMHWYCCHFGGGKRGWL